MKHILHVMAVLWLLMRRKAESLKPNRITLASNAARFLKSLNINPKNIVGRLFPDQLRLPLSTLLLLLLIVFGQQGSGQVLAKGASKIDMISEVQPLAIGDILPNDIWESKLKLLNVGEGETTGNLGAFKGRLIILDFWATWCSSCIKKMPEMQQMQKRFGDRVKILLVNERSTKDDRQKILNFLSKGLSGTKERFELTSVYADTTLTALFPHNSIPHQVWLSPEGFVLAITAAGEVTEGNIRRILDGEDTKLYTKLNVDKNRPLFSSEMLPENNVRYYGIMLKGKIDGLGGGSRYKRRDDGAVYGRSIYNHSLTAICQMIGEELIPNYSTKNLVVDVKDSSQLFPGSTGASSETWQRENFYSLEVLAPAGHIYEQMLELINRNTDYRLEKKVEKQVCYILSTLPGNSFKTKGGNAINTLFEGKLPELTNYPLKFLVNRLNELPFVNYHVLDETNYTGNVDLVFPSDVKNFSVLKTALEKQGIKITQETRSIEILSLTDALNPNKR